MCNPDALVNWQSLCSTCGHCRVGAHMVTDLNLLVQSAESEGSLEWRKAGVDMKV